MARPKQTTVRRKGRNRIDINFNEKDGKNLAKRLQGGGSLWDLLGGVSKPEEPATDTVQGVDVEGSDGADS
jgi:hypothetical protein